MVLAFLILIFYIFLLFFLFFFFFFFNDTATTEIYTLSLHDALPIFELRRDSRVTTGNSGFLLCWPRQVQSSIRVAKESWGLLSSDWRANRPHLGLCPEANIPLQGPRGSRGCLPDAPGETGIHLEWKKNPALLTRRDRYLLELTGWTKGSQA